jgi:hypothetical protein
MQRLALAVTFVSSAGLASVLLHSHGWSLRATSAVQQQRPDAPSIPVRSAASAERERAVKQQLNRNSALAGRLKPLVPANGDLMAASDGFWDLGQFVAALHVAHNLDIPFDMFHARMMGLPRLTLGQTIQALKPAVNADAAVRKAEREADAELRATGARVRH